MHYIIGDIGNTNIKICKVNHKFKIKKTFIFSTKNIYLEKNLEKKLKNLITNDTCDKILLSSVVPRIYRKVKKIFRKRNYNIFEIKNFPLNKLMKFKVKQYSQLGSDRIANAIGAYYKFRKDCIVIDFGTATTFDIIKKTGIYDGGVIAPGIKLSIENLFLSTALLPMFELKKYPSTYGKNTKEALKSGFFWGYQGLIDNIIKKIEKKSGRNFKIILTGGYSNLFKNKISRKTEIERDITIEGIIKIYRKFLT